MENKLNKWFDAAKHNPPMIPIKEVGAMISNPPAVKGRLSTLKKTVFMGTILGIILSLWFWFNQTELTIKKEVSQLLPVKSETEYQNNIPLQRTEQFVSDEKRGTNDLLKKAERHPDLSFENEKNKVEARSGISFALNSTVSPTNRGYNYDHEPISLTYEELLKLGIRTDGNVLDYKNINGALSHSDTVNTIFHLDVEEHGSRRTNKGHPDTDGKVKSISKSFWPAAIQIISNKDTDLIVVENMNHDWEHPFFCEAQKFLIPVLTTTIAKPGKYSYDLQLIFWFKPEADFLNALPTDIATSLREEYPISILDKYKLVYAQYTDRIKGIERVKGFDSVRVALLIKEYLTLSEDELRALNIEKLSDGVKYENRFYENGKINEIKLARKGDLTNVSVNDKMYRVKRIRKRDKPFTAVVVTNPKLTHNTYLFVYPDSIGYGKRHDKSVMRFNKDAEDLIAIQVDSQTVFWFPETEEFMKALPERIQNKLGVNIANLNRPQIAPVKYIELTDEQLAKFGIKRNPESITVPMHTGEGKYLMSDYSSKGTVFHFNSVTPTTESLKSPAGGIKFKVGPGGSATIAPAEPKQPKLAYPSPSLITEGNGLHWLTYQTDEEMSKEDQDYMVQNGLSPLTYKPAVEARKIGETKLAAALNTYIALKVKSNEIRPEGTRNPDLIIWYKPDSLLFAVLPGELSEQIKQELQGINVKKSGSACQFFEACLIVKGTIQQCTVYPNPASDQLQIKIELGEARLVSIYLTDISGKKVKDFFQNETQERGAYTYQSKLEGLSEGMYLLHITTDKGEYIVQRVIKKG